MFLYWGTISSFFQPETRCSVLNSMLNVFLCYLMCGSSISLSFTLESLSFCLFLLYFCLHFLTRSFIQPSFSSLMKMNNHCKFLILLSIFRLDAMYFPIIFYVHNHTFCVSVYRTQTLSLKHLEEKNGGGCHNGKLVFIKV